MKEKKSKAPTKEEMKEEILSLAMTVKYLLEDVEYMLDNKDGSERRDDIRNYVVALKDFFKTGSVKE